MYKINVIEIDYVCFDITITRVTLTTKINSALVIYLLICKFILFPLTQIEKGRTHRSMTPP